MSFPRYPRYKDSGVEWLGEVPEHWEVKRLRFIAALNPSKSEVAQLDRATVVSFLPMEAIGEDGQIEREREKPIADVESGYTYFRDGDVVVAKITPCFENGKGALVTDLTNGIGFGTTELIVVRPMAGQIDGRFLHLLFQSREFRSLGEARMYGAGGQKRVPDSFVRDFATAFPPLADQLAIVTFVDHETAKIDVLIAEQQRLIELLKEKRQAVISHAVTRGLNPDAPMKPSGVEWLGDVPAHWSVCLLKRTFRSVDYGISDSLLPAGEIAVLRMGNIVEGQIKLDDLKFVDAVDPDLLLVRGDLLFNRTNSLDLIGKVGMFNGSSDGRFSFASYLVRLRTVDRVDPTYLTYLCNTRGLLGVARASAFVAIGQCNLNPSRYGHIPVVIPPDSEQREIVAHLERETANIDELLDDTYHAIALLQERRTALISAAVTGKIDVRGLAQAEAA